MEAMRTVVTNPKEIKELSVSENFKFPTSFLALPYVCQTHYSTFFQCGGDLLGGTAEKFPQLIVVKRPDNTIETVVIRVEGNVITGKPYSCFNIHAMGF